MGSSQQLVAGLALLAIIASVSARPEPELHELNPLPPADLPKEPAKLTEVPAKTTEKPAKLTEDGAKLPEKPAKLTEDGAKLPEDGAKVIQEAPKGDKLAEDAFLASLPQAIPGKDAVQVPVVVADFPEPEAVVVVPNGPRGRFLTRMARAHLPAEARGADGDGQSYRVDRPIAVPGTVLVPYYGGAKGNYLVVPASQVILLPGSGGRGETSEENVGEETNESTSKKPPSGGGGGGGAASGGDNVVISLPPEGASMAEAKPVGIAIAGPGGVAASRPVGTAVVGPGGLAVARPIATAIAGINGAEGLLAGAGRPPPPQFHSKTSQVHGLLPADTTWLDVPQGDFAPQGELYVHNDPGYIVA